jgi:hypothetical protein
MRRSKRTTARTSSAGDTFVANQLLFHPENAIRGIAFAVLVTLAISASERLHVTLWGLSCALLFAFVFLGFQKR